MRRSIIDPLAELVMLICGTILSFQFSKQWFVALLYGIICHVIFINLFHSLIEDTAILLLIGPSLFTILVIRGFFVFAFTFLLIKIFNNFPINAYDRFLFSRPIHNIIKNQK